ncbi:MAG: hypothetical protein DMG96_40660 [Acidobacteria bacterium]|nr:MAG: hypothetical protein DMG96_40660 [Acidobacteriota bacterium]
MRSQVWVHRLEGRKQLRERISDEGEISTHASAETPNIAFHTLPYTLSHLALIAVTRRRSGSQNSFGPEIQAA